MKRLYPGACVVLLVLAGVLCALIRPAADDFYYYTFCDGGLYDYLRSSLLHYRTVTGRVLVHLILCPLLQFHMWPFRLFNLLLTGGLCWLCACLCAETRPQRPPLFAAGLSMFFLMGLETLSDGVLWGGGSLNYLFPTFLVLLYYAGLQKYLSGGAGGCWLAIPAFLCSATVEMTGLLTVLVILYFLLTCRERWRSCRRAALLNLCAALLGYLSLFTSPGVKQRLEENSAGIGLLQRINVNFSLFDRKACGPEGIWVITLLALLSAAVLLRRKRPPVPALFLLLALGVALTGTGALSYGVWVALLALCAFFALLGYGIWNFLSGERLVPLCMLCTTVSLAVCLVSPVAGPRMMLPSAVFLTVLTLRTLALCRLPDRLLALPVTLLGLSAAAVLCFYIVNFAANARVIDQNDSRARAHRDGTPLQLTCVPDERFGGATVPSAANFGGPYLEGMGLPGLELQCTDPTARPIFREGRPLNQEALLRGGRYYVPVRLAASLPDTSVRWELASAVVTLPEGEYRFHQGDRAANRTPGVGPSVRLSAPVRMIDSRIYIAQQDFENLFHVELSLQP